MYLLKVLTLIISISLFTSCGKDNVDTVNEEIDSTATLLYSGVFMSEAHSTSGKASIYKSTDGKNILRIQSLNSESGPDLRLYLADDKKALNSFEVVSKPNNGTYDLAIPAGIDFKKQKFVLIWCKQFSVLFGSAELK